MGHACTKSKESQCNNAKHTSSHETCASQMRHTLFQMCVLKWAIFDRTFKRSKMRPQMGHYGTVRNASRALREACPQRSGTDASGTARDGLGTARGRLVDGSGHLQEGHEVAHRILLSIYHRILGPATPPPTSAAPPDDKCDGLSPQCYCDC